MQSRGSQSSGSRPLDITFVCGRRPDLLGKTLASLTRQITAHFSVGTVHANIDPFCGSPADGDKCEALLRDTFPKVQVRRPGEASFGAAVKWLWQQPATDLFLHMEDDWEILHPIAPDDVLPRFVGAVTQVQLASRDRLYLPKTYSFKASWRKTFGLKLFKKVHLDEPLFATSPSFLVSNFARVCAEMMDPGKDPEKQLFAPGTPLREFTRDYRNHPLQAPGRQAVVRDLGRDWLSDRRIRKRIQNGISIWEKL